MCLNALHDVVHIIAHERSVHLVNELITLKQRNCLYNLFIVVARTGLYDEIYMRPYA